MGRNWPLPDHAPIRCECQLPAIRRHSSLRRRAAPRRSLVPLVRIAYPCATLRKNLSKLPFDSTSACWIACMGTASL